MSVGSILKKVLGFVAGILIPGASATTTDLVHAIQQELADAFGAGPRISQQSSLSTRPG